MMLTIKKYIAEIALVIVVLFIYYLSIPVSASTVLFVPQGSISKIIAHLKAENVDVNAFDAKVLSLIGKVQYGWLSLPSDTMRKGDFLVSLTRAKAAQKSITLIPGETTYFFLRELATAFDLNVTILHYYYNRLSPYKEGAFRPETYSLPKGIDEMQAMEILLRRSLEKQEALSKELLGSFNPSQWKRVLVIASIIQKEAANKEEMPLISSVIYNRLRKKMPLQMDGTLNYGKYSHVKITPSMIRNNSSRYNTYRYRGLPPELVCNVGDAAIKAALQPQKTSYLYFVKGKNGFHNFGSYYSTHIKNIQNATK